MLRVVSGGLVVAVAVAGCGQGTPQASQRADAQPSLRPPAPSAPAPLAAPPLVDPPVDLRAPPVPIPLRLAIPALSVEAPMLAVGQTAARDMDAPKGPASDRVWQEAFWYRGGEEPGAPGIATVAGHVDDSLARPAIFTRLQTLRPGDSISVIDTRTGLATRFHVVATHSYTLAEASTRTVLERVFGLGAVTESAADKAKDVATGVSRLNLITCAGDFRHGQFDHRYVVYAVRDSGTAPGG